MFNLLVAVEHSLEASFALRMACFIDKKIHIQPIYVIDPPSRDLTLGTGWARKSWERETRRQAEVFLEDLLLAERTQCADIRDPVIMAGDPIQEITGHFWQGGYDILVVGSPFREIGSLALGRQMHHAAKKARRELPLLVVRHLKNIRHVVALTDGSALAENALGLLTRLGSYLSFTVTLVGLPPSAAPSTESQSLNLERGQAILKEKGIDAAGFPLAGLSGGELTRRLKAADLVVSPFPTENHHSHLYGLSDHEIQALLFYLGVPATAT
jgi:hypothetical protein